MNAKWRSLLYILFGGLIISVHSNWHIGMGAALLTLGIVLALRHEIKEPK